MLAKLIVSGPTREVAIRKLYAALEEYEVVGLSTNIEFLKKICTSPAFIAGDVETGYIQKHNHELFAHEVIDPETYAQAALGLLTKELSSGSSIASGPHGLAIGFDSRSPRQFTFITSNSPGTDAKQVLVTIDQSGRNFFDVRVNGAGIDESYPNIVCEPQTPSILTFFPHTRIESTVITNGDDITLFQKGKQTKLTLASPGWYEKALGLKDVANSVLAPMPCKVLRNEVKEGDAVEKDQALVV